MWTHPGKKLLFMGGEIGQWDEWNHNESIQWNLLEWDNHKGLQRLVGDLNRLYVQEGALHERDFEGEGFEWIDCLNGQDSVLAYLRKGLKPHDQLVVCSNFTPVVRHQYHVGVPELGYYQEVFNSDSSYYGGSNVGNHPGVEARSHSAQSRPYSLRVTLPPLGTVVFKKTS